MATKKADKESGTPSAKPDAAPKATKRVQKVHNVAHSNEKVPVKTAEHNKIVKSSAKPAVKRAPGRVSTYSDEVAAEICARISEGQTLRDICRDETMPAWRTVYDWRDSNKQFAARLAHARDVGADAIAQECLEIADFGLNDTYVDEEGRKKTDVDVIQRSKLRIETRLKLLAVWNPAKYGSKVDVNHGGQPGNPVQTTTRVVMVPAKDKAVVETRPLAKDDEQ